MPTWLIILLILLALAAGAISGYFLGFMLAWKLCFYIAEKIIWVYQAGGEVGDMQKFIKHHASQFAVKKAWRAR